MKIIISTILRRAEILLTAYSTKIEDIPKILQLLADFLKKEPTENYLTTHIEDAEEPLTLTPEAKERFKIFTEDYPLIYKSGEPKVLHSSFNLLYVIGEVLTQITMPLEALSMKNHELEYPINALYHIWGSIGDMSSWSIVNKFKNRSAGDAKKMLVSKLEASAETLKKEILTLLK
jgi:hypothetical protein